MSELLEQGLLSEDAAITSHSEAADDVFGMLRLIGAALLVVLGLVAGAFVGSLIALGTGLAGIC